MSPRNIQSSSDLLQMFICCMPATPPPQRRKIDRSMIGNPTDFRHTAHLGADDLMGSGTSSTNNVSLLQEQMSSKNFIPVVPSRSQLVSPASRMQSSSHVHQRVVPAYT